MFIEETTASAAFRKSLLPKIPTRVSQIYILGKMLFSDSSFHADNIIY